MFYFTCNHGVRPRLRPWRPESQHFALGLGLKALALALALVQSLTLLCLALTLALYLMALLTVNGGSDRWRTVCQSRSGRGVQRHPRRHKCVTEILRGDKNEEVRGTKFKIVATRCHILRLKCTKFDFGWGSVPDPAGGAHSARQTP